MVEAILDGEDVVVWRTERGVPCVMEARCPHQWSHLGGSGAVAAPALVPGMFIGLAISRLARPMLDRSWFRPAVLFVSLAGGVALMIGQFV